MGKLSLCFVTILVAFGPFFGSQQFAVTEAQLNGKKRAWERACLRVSARA